MYRIQINHIKSHFRNHNQFNNTGYLIVFTTNLNTQLL